MFDGRDWRSGRTIRLNSTCILRLHNGCQYIYPLRAASGSNNYGVDWGDGTVQSYTSTAPTHTYASADTYTIKITPAGLPIIHNSLMPFLELLCEIDGTGGTSLTSLYFGFWGASN